MKILILVVILAFVAADEDYFVLDEIDPNALFTNIKEMKRFIDCLTDTVPCKKEYQSYRANAAEAIQQACKRCSTEQKLFALQFLTVVQTNFPKEFIEFKNKYDPEHKFFDRFESVANKFKAS